MLGINQNIIGRAQSPNRILSFNVDDHGGIKKPEAEVKAFNNDNYDVAASAKFALMQLTDFDQPAVLSLALNYGRTNFDNCNFTGESLSKPFEFIRAFACNHPNKVKPSDLSFKGAKFKNVVFGYDFKAANFESTINGDFFNAENVWNSSISYLNKGVTGKELDLSGVDFSKAGFDNVVFVSTNLAFANFENLIGVDEPEAFRVYFINSNLAKASFARSNLKQVKFFPDANLESVDFTMATLKRCNFLADGDCRLGNSIKNAKFRGADLFFADLRYLDFSNADMRGTRLIKSLLEGVNFTGASLIAAKFRHSILAGAKFHAADLRLANFVMAFSSYDGFSSDSANNLFAHLRSANTRSDDFINYDPSSNCYDKDTKVFGVLMPSLIERGGDGFVRADDIDNNFAGYDLSEMYIDAFTECLNNDFGFVLKDANFANVDFSNSYIENAVFNSCYFINARFDTSFLENIKFNNSNLKNALFDDCEIADLEFLKTCFSPVTIINSEFNDCKFNNTSFMQSSITPDSKFNNCKHNAGLFEAFKVTRLARTMNNDEYRAYFVRLTQEQE